MILKIKGSPHPRLAGVTLILLFAPFFVLDTEAQNPERREHPNVVSKISFLLLQYVDTGRAKYKIATEKELEAFLRKANTRQYATEEKRKSGNMALFKFSKQARELISKKEATENDITDFRELFETMYTTADEDLSVFADIETAFGDNEYDLEEILSVFVDRGQRFLYLKNSDSLDKFNDALDHLTEAATEFLYRGYGGEIGTIVETLVSYARQLRSVGSDLMDKEKDILTLRSHFAKRVEDMTKDDVKKNKR